MVVPSIRHLSLRCEELRSDLQYRQIPRTLKQRLNVWPQLEASAVGVSTMAGGPGWDLPQDIGLISLTLIQSLNVPLAPEADLQGLNISPGLPKRFPRVREVLCDVVQADDSW